MAGEVGVGGFFVHFPVPSNPTSRLSNFSKRFRGSPGFSHGSSSTYPQDCVVLSPSLLPSLELALLVGISSRVGCARLSRSYYLRRSLPPFPHHSSKSSACDSHGLCLCHLSPPDQHRWPRTRQGSQCPAGVRGPQPPLWMVALTPGTQQQVSKVTCEELSSVQTHHRRWMETSSSCSPLPSVCPSPVSFLHTSKICETNNFPESTDMKVETEILEMPYLYLVITEAEYPFPVFINTTLVKITFLYLLL